MSADKPQFIYVLEALDPAKAATRDNWTDYDRETFDLHWARLEQMRDDRVLLMAGRSLHPDGIGPAIVVFEADSEDEARHFVETEPFVTRGFARATLYPFRVAISRNEL